MTDDRQPDEMPSDADRRDEHVAGLLEVEPLDELTRRRLVARALEQQGAGTPSTRGRWVMGAAAAVVAALIGVTAVVLARDGDDTTVAERPGAGEGGAPAEQELTEERDAPGSDAADEAAEPQDALAPLPDLGEVSDAERLRAALSGGFAGVEGPIPQPCVEELAGRGADAPHLVGTGHVGGEAEPAYVVVADRGGASTAFVLRADPGCSFVYAVPL